MSFAAVCAFVLLMLIIILYIIYFRIRYRYPVCNPWSPGVALTGLHCINQSSERLKIKDFSKFRKKNGARYGSGD